MKRQGDLMAKTPEGSLAEPTSSWRVGVAAILASMIACGNEHPTTHGESFG
jgi:hypothetical protein